MHTNANELLLYLDNEGRLYPQVRAIQRNLVNKIADGKYDGTLAPRMWLYVVDSASKMYRKDFGTSSGRGNHAFAKKVRDEVATAMARRFEREAALGEHAHYLQKKYLR